MAIKVTDLTPAEAVERIKADYPRDGNVMAANYDPDCPNDEDHDEDGTCHCWDGLTLDDVMTWVDGGVLDLDGFAQWGPFQLWEETDEPETPKHTLRPGSDMFHTMDCPACQDTPFTLSPRSETYWSA